tara:strand:+ start:9241 stop:10245 length:1005 start_codon:yes stop_codon:yes gene_type:complete
MDYIIYISFLILIFPINQFIQKKNFLPNQTGDKHQIFVTKDIIPLSGGIYILFAILILFKNNINLCLFFVVFFLFGLASDKKYISSPLKRFLIQLFFIIAFVLFFDLRISDLRNPYIQDFLNIKFVSYIFVIFCFLVLVNGSNFIDGLNGLQLSYYLIIIAVLFKNNLLTSIGIDNINSIFLIVLFFYLVILNFKNKLFLGDNGSYILSLFAGFILIKIYNYNQNISPYYIALLLWYPCFENLFSIVRKLNFNSSPLRPDNKHLHQLLYLFIKKKYKYDKLFSNNLSSILINTVNLIIILIGSLNYNHTIIQIILIIFSSLFYTKLYLSILKKI